MSHVSHALDDEAKAFLAEIHVNPILFAGLESCQLFSKNLLKKATRRCLYRAFTGPVATDIYFKIHPVQDLPTLVQTTLISAGIPSSHFTFFQKLDMGCKSHALLRISATEDNLVDVGCPRGAAGTLAEMIRQYFVKQDQLQAKDAAANEAAAAAAAAATASAAAATAAAATAAAAAAAKEATTAKAKKKKKKKKKGKSKSK